MTKSFRSSAKIIDDSDVVFSKITLFPRKIPKEFEKIDPEIVLKPAFFGYFRPPGRQISNPPSFFDPWESIPSP